MTKSTDRSEPTPATGFARTAFETERLLLRALDLADAPAVRHLAGAAEVARTAFVPHPYPEGAAEA